MHLTLLKDGQYAAGQEPAREQLDRFRAFQRVYNEERPHQALGNATPAEHYLTSLAAALGRLRCASPTIRSTMRSGACVRTAKLQMAGPARLPQLRSAGEPVGLAAENAHGWTVSFGPVVLGSIAHGGDRLGKLQTRRLWTCGQRCALPTRSTVSATAAADLNETKNYVTHVVGQICYLCSRLLSPLGRGEGRIGSRLTV